MFKVNTRHNVIFREVLNKMANLSYKIFILSDPGRSPNKKLKISHPTIFSSNQIPEGPHGIRAKELTSYSRKIKTNFGSYLSVPV